MTAAVKPPLESAVVAEPILADFEDSIIGIAAAALDPDTEEAKIAAASAPTVRFEASGKALAVTTMSVPDKTVVPPMKVLVPDKFTLPDPVLIRPPSPL